MSFQRYTELIRFISTPDTDISARLHNLLSGNPTPSLEDLYALGMRNCIVHFTAEEEFRVWFSPAGPVLVDRSLQPYDQQEDVTYMISEFFASYSELVHEESPEELVPYEGETEDTQTATEEKPPSKAPSSPTLTSTALNTSAAEADACPICMDPWTTGGEHRLGSLKCGHLFGERCVMKWLKSQPVKERCCPTCKARALIRDFRYIYARRLVATDTTEVCLLQKKLEISEAEKNRIQIQLQQTRSAHRSALIQLQTLQTQLTKPHTYTSTSWKYVLEKNVVLQRAGCRVSTYSSRTYELFLSSKSNTNLFSGYGITKINCVDNKLGNFIFLHPKPIRDLDYSSEEDLILSASLDGTARIIQRGSSNFVVNAITPLWSCAWDYIHSNNFILGAIGGKVSYYDIRRPNSPIFSASTSSSPIVSLAAVPGGFFSCSLTTATYWSADCCSGGFIQETLPLDGPFVNMSYNPEADKVLVYCRPGPSDRSRLYVYKPLKIDGKIKYSIEKTFRGSMKSSVMCRAGIVSVGGGAASVCAYSESEGALQVFPLARGDRPQNIQCSEPVLDVTGVCTPHGNYLASLSDNKLRMYKSVSI